MTFLEALSRKLEPSGNINPEAIGHVLPLINRIRAAQGKHAIGHSSAIDEARKAHNDGTMRQLLNAAHKSMEAAEAALKLAPNPESHHVTPIVTRHAPLTLPPNVTPIRRGTYSYLD